MDEYDLISKSKLKFKGEKKNKSKKEKHHRLDSDDFHEGSSGVGDPQLDELREDAESHGGWWSITSYEQIRDDVAIEFVPGCYAHALSNGRIVMGRPHPPGDGPDEEEIFIAIGAGTNQVALKSGFDRYLGIDSKGRLKGVSEAVSELETFLPVFEDGKLALCAQNDCFLAPDNIEEELSQIVAKSEKVGPNEIVRIRTKNDLARFSKQKKDSTLMRDEDVSKILKTELGNLKKKNSRDISLDEEKERIKKARQDGQLYEALLDTRVKHKSDKYCK